MGISSAGLAILRDYWIYLCLIRGNVVGVVG